MKYLVFLPLVFLVGACSTGIDLTPYSDKAATPKAFHVCHGYGCTSRTQAGFSPAQWQKIGAVFTPAAKTAAVERTRIAKAVALMETYTGEQAGTETDRAEAETFEKDDFQQDCIDETANTSLYVSFLAKEGLLRFHEPAPPLHRGYFIDGAWPHNTAAIREKAGGAVYVVDTYYRDNGQEPYIMPAGEWLGGWRPEKLTP